MVSWFTKKFTKFKEPKEGKGIEELGSGIYLTGLKNYASMWSGNSGFIYECYVRKGPIFNHSIPINNQLITKMHNGHSDLMNSKFGPNSAYDINSFKKLFKERGYIRTISGNRISPFFLKLAGFIGAIDHTSQIPDQIVIFNPNDVFIAARTQV